MKKITALLIFILSWYIAGKYRYFSLMILAFAELLLFAVMLILPRVAKHFVNVEFSAKNQIVYKNIPLPCNLKLENRSILPLNRLKIKIQLQYRPFPKNRRTKGLFCSAKINENSRLQFHFRAPYCGLLQAEVRSCQVYDFLALFSSHKKIKSTSQIAVLPPQRALKLEFSDYNPIGGINFGECHIHQNGDDHSEFLQMREYRSGDSMRTIHWNYSAKTDRLWVKEYNHEADRYIHLVIDTSIRQDNTIERTDAFYEVLSALIESFVQKSIPVCVYWNHDEKGGLQSMEITSSTQREEMLLQLYQAPFAAQASLPPITADSTVMSFNLNLEWSCNMALVYRFSPQGFEKEIYNQTFIL